MTDHCLRILTQSNRKKLRQDKSVLQNATTCLSPPPQDANKVLIAGIIPIGQVVSNTRKSLKILQNHLNTIVLL